MGKFGALALAASLLGSVVMAAPSSGVGNEITLTVAPERIQLAAQPGAETATAKLSVRVKTAASATMTVRVTDVVANESGNWVPAPGGSTSYSLQSDLSLSPADVAVSPSPDLQAFPVTISIPVSSMDQPRVGLVQVVLVPSSGSAASGTVVNQGLEIDTVVVAEPAPVAITDASEVQLSLENLGLTLRSSNEFSPVDSLVPDVPGLVDHGPVTAIARYRNNGDFVIDAQTSFDFASVGPLALLPGSDDAGTVFYRVEQVHQYALPGQTAGAGASSEITAPGAAPIDTLPFIGFVKVTATTTGTLGPLAAAPVVQSTVFLVFPWKEALALLLVIVLWVLFKRWRRNRRDRRSEPPPPSEVREPVESVT